MNSCFIILLSLKQKSHHNKMIILLSQKCTYGNKCKFRHPERGPHPHKSVTERLVEHAQRHLQARGPSLSLPLPQPATGVVVSQHQPVCKTRSVCVSSTPSVPKSRSVENVTADPATNAATAYAQQMTQGSQGNPLDILNFF